MRLSPPSVLMFLIAVVLGGLAVASRFVHIHSFISSNQFWLLTVAWGLLVFACLFRISRA